MGIWPMPPWPGDPAGGYPRDNLPSAHDTTPAARPGPGQRLRRGGRRGSRRLPPRRPGGGGHLAAHSLRDHRLWRPGRRGPHRRTAPPCAAPARRPIGTATAVHAPAGVRAAPAPGPRPPLQARRVAVTLQGLPPAADRGRHPPAAAHRARRRRVRQRGDLRPRRHRHAAAARAAGQRPRLARRAPARQSQASGPVSGHRPRHPPPAASPRTGGLQAAGPHRRTSVLAAQWLQVEPTAELTRSLAAQLRGRGFPAAWRMFEASMHIELLPAPAQHLPESTCHPARTWSPATGGNCSTPPYRRRRHAPGPGWRRCAPPRCRTCSSPVTSSNLNTRNG